MPMYAIETLPALRRVSLRFEGIMEQDPDSFFKELTAAISRVRIGARGWDLLVDYSATPVMPQDRAHNTAKIFDWCVEHGMRKVALISLSITQQMQLKRLAHGSDKVGIFDSIVEARDWLAE